jgi:hypothetical protein
LLRGRREQNQRETQHPPSASREDNVKDTKPEKPEDWTPRLSVGDPRSPLGQALRSCQATIIKVADGYTVTVSLRENGRPGALEESTVDTFADAEAIAKAFASQQEFPWEKVEVVFEAVLWANLADDKAP